MAWSGDRKPRVNQTIWKKISTEIIERDGGKCVNCPKTGKGLQVHHLDEFRTNNDPDNLVTLCRDCHLSLYSPRVFSYQRYFDVPRLAIIPKIMGWNWFQLHIMRIWVYPPYEIITEDDDILFPWLEGILNDTYKPRHP